jgi:hypothetical protein
MHKEKNNHIELYNSQYVYTILYYTILYYTILYYTILYFLNFELYMRSGMFLLGCVLYTSPLTGIRVELILAV